MYLSNVSMHSILCIGLSGNNVTYNVVCGINLHMLLSRSKLATIYYNAYMNC